MASSTTRKCSRIIRTASGDRKIPLVASHGTASWVEEEGTIPESDDAFGQITIGAHKIASMIKVSDELLQDSVFDIESYIATEFARRVGDAEEAAFISGDGSGKPYGLLHTTNGATTGVTAASATALTSDELLDLIYSLKSPYRKRAVFLMHDSTIKAIRKLKDGNSQYLWQPGMKEGEPDRLLGYRLVTSTHMPVIAADAKPILFGDLSSYWIADREGRSMQRLNELYAATGQVGFRVTQRVDGRLVQTEGVKCLAMIRYGAHSKKLSRARRQRMGRGRQAHVPARRDRRRRRGLVRFAPWRRMCFALYRRQRGGHSGRAPGGLQPPSERPARSGRHGKRTGRVR